MTEQDKERKEDGEPEPDAGQAEAATEPLEAGTGEQQVPAAPDGEVGAQAPAPSARWFESKGLRIAAAGVAAALVAGALFLAPGDRLLGLDSSSAGVERHEGDMDEHDHDGPDADRDDFDDDGHDDDEGDYRGGQSDSDGSPTAPSLGTGQS